jgi:hypothetical protein
VTGGGVFVKTELRPVGAAATAAVAIVSAVCAQPSRCDRRNWRAASFIIVYINICEKKKGSYRPGGVGDHLASMIKHISIGAAARQRRNDGMVGMARQTYRHQIITRGGNGYSGKHGARQYQHIRRARRARVTAQCGENNRQLAACGVVIKACAGENGVAASGIGISVTGARRVRIMKNNGEMINVVRAVEGII